jgi:hypothetical protein
VPSIEYKYTITIGTLDLDINGPQTCASALSVVSIYPAISLTCALQYVIGEKEPHAHSTSGTLPTSFPFSVFVSVDVGNVYLSNSCVDMRFSFGMTGCAPFSVGGAPTVSMVEMIS